MSACETNFIYKETPVWNIDWINKVFDVANNIDTLEEVFVGWAPYRSVTSVAWNRITLDEAPPIGTSINVDYFYLI